MHTGLTAPADVFHELPAAQALACGITAHLVDPSHLRPARAWRHDRHDRIDAARYTGWYADCYQYEILTGYVYAFEADTDDVDDDDDAPTTYYAIVESDDTDLHYLSPDAYDEPLEAVLAADRMAELIAELERECNAIRNQAAHAREQLAEGNRDGPAGLLIATTDGTDPAEAARTQGMSNAIYAHRVTRRQAESTSGVSTSKMRDGTRGGTGHEHQQPPRPHGGRPGPVAHQPQRNPLAVRYSLDCGAHRSWEASGSRASIWPVTNSSSPGLPALTTAGCDRSGESMIWRISPHFAEFKVTLD